MAKEEAPTSIKDQGPNPMAGFQTPVSFGPSPEELTEHLKRTSEADSELAKDAVKALKDLEK